MDVWRKLISGVILALLLGMSNGRAQAPPTEYQLKAAFLYHFAQFVEWPREVFNVPATPFVIGILGDNPFDDELAKAVTGKSINEHPLVVKEIKTAAEAATNCHILFICSSEKKRLPAIVAELHDARVLTVGEMPRFTETGGMINFVLEGTKIRFQVNAPAATTAGLKISAKLMSLATRGK